MLQSITIQNLGLVQDLHLEFENGFTTLTGETGAGKSFFCRGIELAMGGRAKEKFAEKTVLELEWNNIIFRRVFQKGRSRFFIDDEPCGLKEGQKNFASSINMHSQHDNLFLKQKNAASTIFNFSLANQSVVENFSNAYQKYITAKKAEVVLKKELEILSIQKDFLEFQSQKMAKIEFSAEELNEAQNILLSGDNAPERKKALEESIEMLAGEGDSVLGLLDKTQGLLQKNFPEEAKKIDDFFISIPSLVQILEEKIPHDDGSKQIAQNLIDKVDKWRKEFGAASIEALLEKKESIDSQLKKIEILSDEVLDQEERTKSEKKNATHYAQELSNARKNQQKIFEDTLSQKCSELGMPVAIFKVDFSPCILSPYGIEETDFLFSANKNQAPASLRKIASGGEIARITLALKNFWPPETTMIFDEIDTGVSGHIAEKMAEEMKSLAKNRQIFAITHLPQIAAKADHHFVVEKTHFKNHTQTTIRKVEGKERVEIIANMLSGENVTEEARAAAKKLLEA